MRKTSLIAFVLAITQLTGRPQDSKTNQTTTNAPAVAVAPLRGINLRCGNIAYTVSVTGQGTSGGSEYKDSDLAVSFGAQPLENMLACTISNTSPKTIVIRWGSKDQQYIVDSIPQAMMSVNQLRYNPFSGGTMTELKADMKIEPSQTESVYVIVLAPSVSKSQSGQISIDFNSIHPELLPLDPQEAQKLKGKIVKLILPLGINGEEIKRTIEFRIDAVVNTAEKTPSATETKK
jgi:hypothetical protein